MHRLAVAVLLLLIAPTGHAAERWDGDDYLACLVGQGAVALRHGSSAQEALNVAMPTCEASMEPEGSAAAADGDYIDYISGAALTALTAIEGAHAF